MDIQEMFYWTASIALILLGLFIIALFALLFYIKRSVDKTATNILDRMNSISDQVGSASRAWRNLTLTRFVLRALKLIF
jgi:hypothetical protein